MSPDQDVERRKDWNKGTDLVLCAGSVTNSALYSAYRHKKDVNTTETICIRRKEAMTMNENEKKLNNEELEEISGGKIQ